MNGIKQSLCREGGFNPNNPLACHSGEYPEGTRAGIQQIKNLPR
jgi:hypothetical protein